MPLREPVCRMPAAADHCTTASGRPRPRSSSCAAATAAFVVGDAAYLARTWHPRTRPADLDAATGPAWRGLTVLATADGREDDSIGEVEFEAAHDGGVLHERSRFIRRAGRWVYVDGDMWEPGRRRRESLPLGRRHKPIRMPRGPVRRMAGFTTRPNRRISRAPHP